ncbi:MAG: hypothetical protein CMO60_00275 [Verrucomicrobiales bacterium]|nr:hypothetical protein [Verrucomicrobiales bacterium]
MNRVLVTGADGFIGAHICKQLLEAGYAIRASVHNSEAERCQFLKDDVVLGVADADVELIQLDLNLDAGWDSAMDGCDLVVHAASPLPKGKAYLDDQTIIATAIDGTMRCLKAAHGQVTRVVMTSSIAAVMYTNGRASDPRRDDLPPITEADWSQTAGKNGDIGTYHVSKTLAEQAAWDFVDGLPDDDGLELVVINPSVVVGPVLSRWVGFSVDLLYRIAKGQVKVLPNCPMMAPVVDVRDVAKAHVKALTNPDAPGNRYILHQGHLDMFKAIDKLGPEFKAKGYKWPWFNVPYAVVRLAGRFNDEINAMTRLLGPGDGRYRRADGSKVTHDLGVEYRDPVQAVRDTLDSFRTVGLIE